MPEFQPNWMMSSYWNRHRPFELVNIASRMDLWGRCECGAPTRIECTQVARLILKATSPDEAELLAVEVESETK